MGDLNDLRVYQMATLQATEIFEHSKFFPKEEEFSLTSQIRRCSRSVCANMAEGYRKRSYRRHFLLKLTGADAENQETAVWLDFANQCGYIDEINVRVLKNRNTEIGRMLGHMIKYPEKVMSKPK